MNTSPHSPDQRPAAPAQAHRDEYDEPIDIGRFLLPLWAGRLWIVAAAIAGALIAGVIAWNRPAVYESTATLMLMPPRVGMPGAAQATTASYRALIEGNSLAIAVIKQFKLNEPPHRLTPNRFVNGALSVDEIRNTNLMRVRIRMVDPALAAEVANAVAARAVEMNNAITTQEYAANNNSAQVQVERAREQLTKASQALLEFKKVAQVDLIKADTDAILNEREDLLRLLVDVETEKARILAAERELAALSPMSAAPRDVAAEAPLWRALAEGDEPRRPAGAAAREARDEKRATENKPTVARHDNGNNQAAANASEQTANGQKSGKGVREKPVPPPTPERRTPRTPEPPAPPDNPAEKLDLSNPMMNPVFEILRYQAAAGRTKLAGLERQLKALTSDRRLGGNAVDELATLYTRQIQLARLEADHDLAKEIYGDVASRYEQMRIQTDERNPQLQVVDAAVPSDTPLSRQRIRTVFLGTVAGAALAGLLVLASGLFRGTEPARA